MKKQRWWFEGTREKIERLRDAVKIDKAHNGGDNIDVMLRWMELAKNETKKEK